MGRLLSLSKPYISQYRADLLGAFFDCGFVCFVYLFLFCFSLDKSWFLSQNYCVASKLFGFWVCFVSFFFKSSRQLNSEQLSSFLKQNYLFNFVGYSLVPDQLIFTWVRLHIRSHKYWKFILLGEKLTAWIYIWFLPCFQLSVLLLENREVTGCLEDPQNGKKKSAICYCTHQIQVNGLDAPMFPSPSSDTKMFLEFRCL